MYIRLFLDGVNPFNLMPRSFNVIRHVVTVVEAFGKTASAGIRSTNGSICSVWIARLGLAGMLNSMGGSTLFYNTYNVYVQCIYCYLSILLHLQIIETPVCVPISHVLKQGHVVSNHASLLLRTQVCFY